MLISPRCVLAIFAGSITALGCKSSNPSTQPQGSGSGHSETAVVQPGNKTAQSASTPAIEDQVAAPGTAQALAQRAANYAQTVGPLLSEHPPVKATDGAEWPDPDSMRLTAQRPAGQNATGVPDPKASGGDQRAFAAASSGQPDVRIVRQGGDVSQAPQNSLPATDAQTAAFARRAREYPQDLSAQTDDQLLKLLQEQSVPDLQSMAGLAPEDRELLSALMDSLTNFRNQLRQNNNMLFSKKIAPLVDMSDRLRGQAELTVPTFAFVSQAPGFGRYEVIDPGRFIAGKPHTVGVYYEVENFASQLNENKLYETKLTETIVLYTESSGLPVWSDRKSILNDTAHRRRHDFFNAKNITFPATLTIGRYLLKVTIEDQQAHRIAENTVPVEFVAQ